MIVILRILYAAIFAVMIAVTAWAATQENILKIPPVVLNDAWFKATLFDAYFAFLSFYLWVCYREKTNLWRIFWFFAIVFLGNIAMSVYVLIALHRLKPGDGAAQLFARP
ncbi:MAG: DUF1475 family protein [Leptolyngbya sp.]|nr:DUF1475 family protein [Candidatus Melainabacteria bacterium]